MRHPSSFSGVSNQMYNSTEKPDLHLLQSLGHAVVITLALTL